MKKYSVRFTTNEGAVYVYTTEKASVREAVNDCGFAFRFGGHNTDTITEIAVHEIF